MLAYPSTAFVARRVSYTRESRALFHALHSRFPRRFPLAGYERTFVPLHVHHTLIRGFPSHADFARY
jgi:hypothetical protein